jgi:hypothetical protein
LEVSYDHLLTNPPSHLRPLKVKGFARMFMGEEEKSLAEIIAEMKCLSIYFIARFFPLGPYDFSLPRRRGRDLC